MGLSVDDMKQLTFGLVLDMLIENGNDQYDYDTSASQDDYDRF